MRVAIHGATLDIKIPSVTIREGDRVEEMNRVRLRTMEHMLLSKRISAHVTSVNEIDFEHVVRLRRKLKAKYAEQGVKLTYGPFIMKAVTEALQEYPILNASVDGTRIVDLKAYFPVCDRVQEAKIPQWLAGWPEWMPENGIGLEEGEG